MKQRWQRVGQSAGTALVGHEGKKQPVLKWDRSQRPRSLRCGSAVIRLLGLRVRIPPGS
jgi:hypothetical protein